MLTWAFDVVIAGAGCVGLTAAIRARDLGASVLVVDSNFDPGGRMIHSGAFLSLGGGDPVQRRDMKGESDREGFITVDPAEAPEELDDSVDLLFTALTDWSVLDTKAQSPYRYNERELARSWAENCPATRQFLIDNYVRFTRVSGTHGGGGLSRARGARCFLMLGDETDIKAGTITAEDAGVADHVRFELIDYRDMQGPFDRIVSVGMFEHVGTAHFRTFYNKCRELLAPDGVMLIHTIGRVDGPGITDAFTQKYIFPGGYIPALSEMIQGSEGTRLMVTDVEVLRMHYGLTIREWYKRTMAHKADIVALYDERFFRLWTFYLAGAATVFEHGGMVNYQVQYVRDRRALPITRDYMQEAESALRGR